MINSEQRSMPVRRDPISWRQIGVGYVILTCFGVGAAISTVDVLVKDSGLRDVVLYGGFAVLCVIWALLRPLLKRLSNAMAPSPEGQLRLKKVVVGAMWILSILLCFLGSHVSQVVNPW